MTRFIGSVLTVAAAVALFFSSATPAQACGPDSDCVIGERTYRVRMPEGHDGRTAVGAIMFFHGWRGSAAGTMRNKSLGQAVSDMGLALIAPTARPKEDWSIPGSPTKGDDEIAYVRRVLDDVTERFPIDAEWIMATGFSAGGMISWQLACDLSQPFAAFAPIAGTFWEPVPETCTAPAAHVLHVHGTSDRMVPLEGRPIAETRQGNVHDVIAMYAKAGGFGEAGRYQRDGLDCERRTNGDGKALELCLHSGGHSFRARYVTGAWRALQRLGALPPD